MKLINMVMTMSIVWGVNVNASVQESGAALFDTKCSMCHLKSRPVDISSISAPPIPGVMRHVKAAYPLKEDAVNFIVAYALDPKAENAVCLPQKIKRFGLMPSQKGSVSKEELAIIAEWLFERYAFQGKQGAGRGPMR